MTTAEEILKKHYEAMLQETGLGNGMTTTTCKHYPQKPNQEALNLNSQKNEKNRNY